MTIIDKLLTIKKVAVVLFFKALSLPLKMYDLIPEWIKFMFGLALGLIVVSICYYGWKKREAWRHLKL